MYIDPLTKKIIGVALVILAIISLVGAVFAVRMLIEFGAAFDALQANTELDSLGLGVGEIAETFMFVVTMGYVWIIAVIIITLMTFYFGIQMLRGKI